MIQICFICSGNTCRSIMAERLMKKYLKVNNIQDVKVSSRGLNALGENITDNAKIALKKFNTSSANRKSKKLNNVNKNTLYIVMEDRMKSKINSKKVLSMKDILGEDIIDPYGQSEEFYLLTAEKLVEANKKIINEICLWRKL